MSCHCCKKHLSNANITGLCVPCKSNKLIFINERKAVKKYPLTLNDITTSKLLYFKSQYDTYYYVKDIQNLADNLTKNLDKRDPKRKQYMRQINMHSKKTQIKKMEDIIYDSIMNRVNTLCCKLSNTDKLNLENNRVIRLFLENFIKSQKRKNESVTDELINNITNNIYMLIENKLKAFSDAQKIIEKYDTKHKKFAERTLKNLIQINMHDFYSYGSQMFLNCEALKDNELNYGYHDIYNNIVRALDYRISEKLHEDDLLKRKECVISDSDDDL